jgi:hypothetical protein
VFLDLRRELVGHFVDIGRIVDQFQTAYFNGFSLFSDLKRKVVVRFVDIGGIVSSSLRGSKLFFKVKGSGPFTFKP